jgi:hypothetical protein
MPLGSFHLYGFVLLALAATLVWAGANVLDARTLWREDDALGARVRALAAACIGAAGIATAWVTHRAAEALQALGTHTESLQALGGYVGLGLTPVFVLAAGAYFSVWRRLAMR